MQQCARFLTDLAAAAFPHHTGGFAVQLLHLAHNWSVMESNDIDLDDILSLAAAVHMFIKIDPESPASHDILAHFSTSNPTTLQCCTQRGQFGKSHARSSTCWMSWGFELATPTPAAWVEIFGRRLSLWEEEQLSLPQHPNFLAAPPTVLADCTRLIAETHVQNCPFSANSTASQVGASA